MMKRRTFIKTGTVAAAGAFSLCDALARKSDYSYEPDQPLKSVGLRISDALKIMKRREKYNIPPVLCEEILENPNAVFIIRAGIIAEKGENGRWKNCNDQMERLGQRVAKLVFKKGTGKKGRTFIKPNFVIVSSPDNTFINGHAVHPYFVMGMIDELHDLGNRNLAIGARGAMHHNHFIETGLLELFSEHDVPLIEAHVQFFKDYKRSELNWHINPEGMIARRFPAYRPVYDKGTTFINIAHAHTHKVGHTTLTMKNLQGIMPRGYGHTCDSWVTMAKLRKQFMKDFNPNWQKNVEQSYLKHAAMEYKHWNVGGFYKDYVAKGGYEVYLKNFGNYFKNNSVRKGIEKYVNSPGSIDTRIFWAEQWAQRMMDQIEAFPPPYVSMVEGVFGRGAEGIKHSDFIALSRSMVALDAVTSYLMGHDPREIPYLRIANERGLGQNDIEKIAIYELSESGLEKIRDYRDLKRTPMGIYINAVKNGGPLYF